MEKEERYEYRCIDNNWAKCPVAYCKRKKGALTKKLMKTHRCEERKCMHLEKNIEL